MHDNLKTLIESYNEAVDQYHLERLAYAYEFDRLKVPPPAARMPLEELACLWAHRPAVAAVQAVRNFFEDVYDGTIAADASSDAFEALHDAALELTRRFFHVSLTRMGISSSETLD
jgi:hypothetical protein